MKKIICAICTFIIAMTFSVSFVFAEEPDLEITEAYFEENKDTISGAAVIQIENGEISGEYYYGLMDIENNLAASEDSVFEWASITKLLTWTSVMQLVEQGKIELDRDIRDYLPEGFLSRISCDKPITMLNLMHHNAGWAEVDMNKGTDVFSPSEIIDLDDALKKCEPRQIYEPGSVVAYSNFGVALAGYIVERVSGQPCWQYINENIFAPLGMENTAMHPAQLDNPSVGAIRDIEKGYDRDRNYIANHRGYDLIYPAGSAIGTIEDLAKFIIALMPSEGSECTLFQERETLELMLTPSKYYPDNSPRIAHGFWIELRGGKEFFGHGGNYFGFSCNLLFAPETREALIVMTNTAGEMALCLGLMDELLGGLSGLPYETETGAGTAKKVTGTYIMTRIVVDNFRAVDARLFDPIIVKARDDTTIEISYMGEYTQVAPYIFINEQGDILRFVSEDGKVNKILTLNDDLIKRPAGQLVFDYSLFGLVLVAAAYCFVILFVSGLRRLQRLRKPIEKPFRNRLVVLRNIACAFYLAVVANWVLFKQVTEDLFGSAAVTPFLIINALTLPAFAAYVLFFIKAIKTDKKECSKADVRLGVIAGVCLLIELIAVISFNLWR